MVAVFTVPDDAHGRPDPLAEQAERDKTPVFKYQQWRSKRKPIPEVCVGDGELSSSVGRAAAS